MKIRWGAELCYWVQERGARLSDWYAGELGMNWIEGSWGE